MKTKNGVSETERRGVGKRQSKRELRKVGRGWRGKEREKKERWVRTEASALWMRLKKERREKKWIKVKDKRKKQGKKAKKMNEWLKNELKNRRAENATQALIQMQTHRHEASCKLCICDVNMFVKSWATRSLNNMIWTASANRFGFFFRRNGICLVRVCKVPPEPWQCPMYYVQ